ncbi:Intron-binding protein aquarius [Trichinella spiralis]|uniref:Intron-binding protein aquarius n=1 Tax=Trichinella spiralis TaxID=6334 RepID=A0A0V1BJJ0_TRISP|nr:Intron-binding protein aquarius [Trichinella spiralis]
MIIAVLTAVGNAWSICSLTTNLTTCFMEDFYEQSFPLKLLPTFFKFVTEHFFNRAALRTFYFREHTDDRIIMPPRCDVWWDVMFPMLNLSRRSINAAYLGALSRVINANIEEFMKQDEEYSSFYNSFMILALEHLSSNLDKVSVADHSEVKIACKNGLKYLFLKERAVNSVELKYMIAVLKSCLTGESGLERTDIYYLIASIKKAKTPLYFSPPDRLAVGETMIGVVSGSLIHQIWVSHRDDRIDSDAAVCINAKSAEELISRFAYKSFVKNFTSENILLAEELHCSELLLKHFMNFKVIRQMRTACQEAVKRKIFLDCTSMIGAVSDLPIWGSVSGDDGRSSTFSKLLEMSNICMLSIGCLGIAVAINCEKESSTDPGRMEKAIIVANEVFNTRKFYAESEAVRLTVLNFVSNRILLIVKIVSEMLRYSKGIMKLSSWPLLLEIFCETMTSFNFSRPEFTADDDGTGGESIHLFSLVLQIIRTFLLTIFAANEYKLQANREFETVASRENVTKEEDDDISEDTDPAIGRWLSAIFEEVPAMIDDELEKCRLKLESQQCIVADMITAFGKVMRLLEITPRKQFIAGRYLFVPTESDAVTLADIVSDLSLLKNSESYKVEAAVLSVVQNLLSESVIDRSFILAFMNRFGINFESSGHLTWPLQLNSMKVNLLAYVVLCRFMCTDPFTNERIARPIWNRVMKTLELNYKCDDSQVDEPFDANIMHMSIEHMQFLLLLFYNEPAESRRELTLLLLRTLENLLLCDKSCAVALAVLSRLLQIVDYILRFDENPPVEYLKMVYENLFSVPDKSENGELLPPATPISVPEVVHCMKQSETTLGYIYGEGSCFFYNLYHDEPGNEYRLRRIMFLGDDAILSRNLQLALAHKQSKFLSSFWLSNDGSAPFAAYCCYYIRRILLYLTPSPEVMEICNVDRPLHEHQSSCLLLLASRRYHLTSNVSVGFETTDDSDAADKQPAEYLKRFDFRAHFSCFMRCFDRRKNTVDEIEFEDSYLMENYQYGNCAVVVDLMLIELRCFLRDLLEYNDEPAFNFHLDFAETMNMVCLLVRHSVEIIRYLIFCVDVPLQLREQSFSQWHKHCKQLLNIVGDYGPDVRLVHKGVVGALSASLRKALRVFKWDEYGSGSGDFFHHNYEEISHFFEVDESAYISVVFSQHLENIAGASIWDLLNSWKHVLFSASAVLHDYLNRCSPELSVSTEIWENLRRYFVLDTVLAFWPTKNACVESNFHLVEMNRVSAFYEKFFDFLHHSVTTWVKPCSISEFIFANLLSYLKDEELGEKFFQNRSVVELIMPLTNLKSSAIINPIYVIKYLSVLLKIAISSLNRESLRQEMSSSNTILKTKKTISALLNNATILSDAMKIVFQYASDFIEIEDQTKQLSHCESAFLVGVDFVNSLTLCLILLKEAEVVEVGELARYFVHLFLSIDGVDEVFFNLPNSSIDSLEQPLNSAAVKWYCHLLRLAKLNPGKADLLIFEHFCAWVEKFLQMDSLRSVVENKYWKRDQMELMDLMLFLTCYFSFLIGPEDAFLIRKDTSANGQLCISSADDSDSVTNVQETNYEKSKVVAIDCFAATRTGCCSFIVTGRHMCHQKKYYCYDCSVNGKWATVCSACAVKCHNNHDVVYVGNEEMFCQCTDTLKELCATSLNWRYYYSKYLHEMDAISNVHTISDANNIHELKDENKSNTILFDGDCAFCFGELTTEKEFLKDKNAHFATIHKSMIRLFHLLRRAIIVTKEAITPVGHMERLSESFSQFMQGRIQSFETTRLITMRLAQLPAWRKKFVSDDDHLLLCRNCSESASERHKYFYKFCILNSRKSLIAVSSYKKCITIFPVKFPLSRAASKYKLEDLKIDVEKELEISLTFKPTFIQGINGNAAIFLVGGAYDVFIIALNYEGLLDSKKMLKLNMGNEETVRRAFWMPNSASEVVLVTTQRVSVYYLWYSYELPVYCYRLYSGAVADATVAYYEENCQSEKCLTRFIIIMSSDGCLYMEKMGQSQTIPKQDRLKYLRDPLKFAHPDWQDMVVEKLENRGLSVHYSHCLSTLFFGYSNGKNYYCNFSMGSLRNIRTVELSDTGKQSVSIKSWEDVDNLPGFICARPVEFGPILLKFDGPQILVDLQCFFSSPRVVDLKSCLVWEQHTQPCAVIATLSATCSLTLWNVDDNYRNCWSEIPLTSSALYSTQFNQLEECAPSILSCRKSLYPAPVDIFERSSLLDNVKLFSEDVLDIATGGWLINKQPLHFVKKTGAATLHICNTDKSMEISGVKVYIDCSQKESVPSFLAVANQLKYVNSDVSRWYDFPLTYEESINCCSKITLWVGECSGDIMMVHSIHLYGRSKRLQLSALCDNLTDSRQFSTFGKDDSAMLELFNGLHCKQQCTMACVGLQKAELLMGAVCNFLRLYHMNDGMQERKKFFFKNLNLNLDKFHQLLTFNSTLFLKNQAKCFIDHFLSMPDMNRVRIYKQMLKEMEFLLPDPEILDMIVKRLRKMVERRPMNFLRLVFRNNGDSQLLDGLMVLFWKAVVGRKHFADTAPIGSVVFHNMKSFVGCIVDILFSSMHLASFAQLKKFCAILSDMLIGDRTERHLSYMCSQAIQRNVLQAVGYFCHKQFYCEKGDSQDGQEHGSELFTVDVINLKEDDIVNYNFSTLSNYLQKMKRHASNHDSHSVLFPEEQQGSSTNFRLMVDTSNFTSLGEHTDKGLLIFSSDNYQFNILLMLHYLTPYFGECSGVENVPFLQTLLALISAVDVSNLKYAKPFLSLVRRWISFINFKNSFCQRTPEAEANLIKLRFINILLNRMNDRISGAIFSFLMDEGILSFCYDVLENMHPKLANLVINDDLDDEKDVVVGHHFADDLWPFFLHDYVEKNDSNLFVLFDQLAVEIALRLPYQLKRLVVTPEVKERLFSSNWIHLLIKYARCTKASNLCIQVRKLLIYICGSAELCRWHTDRCIFDDMLNNVLRHSRHIFSESTCVSPSQLNTVYHLQMCSMMWRLKICLRIATGRPLSFQKFLLANCEILNELLFAVAVRIHRNITKCVLSLLSVAFDAGSNNTVSGSFAFSPEMARTLATAVFTNSGFSALEQFLSTLVLHTNEGPQNIEPMQFFQNLMKFAPAHLARDFVLYIWRKMVPRFAEYGCRLVHLIPLLSETLVFFTDSEVKIFMNDIVDYFTQERQAILTDPIFALYSKIGKKIPIDGFSFDKRPCFACHRHLTSSTESELSTLVKFAWYSSTMEFLELRCAYEIERIVLTITQKMRIKMIKNMRVYYSSRESLSFVDIATMSYWSLAMNCELVKDQQTVVIDFTVPITARYLLIHYCEFYDIKPKPPPLQTFFNCENCMNSYPDLCTGCTHVALVCENCDGVNMNETAFLCKFCGKSPHATLNYTVRARESASLSPVMNRSDVQSASQEGNLLLAKIENALTAMENDLKEVEQLLEVSVLSAEHDVFEGTETQASSENNANQNVMKASRYEEYLNMYQSRCKSMHRTIILNYETLILKRMAVFEFEHGKLDDSSLTSQYLKCRKSCYCCTLWSCNAVLILIDNLLRKVNFDISLFTSNVGFHGKVVTFVLNCTPLRSDLVCQSILYNLSWKYNFIAFDISQRLAERLFYLLVNGTNDCIGDYLDIMYNCAIAEGHSSDVWSTTMADVFKVALCREQTPTAQSILGVCLKLFASCKFVFFNSEENPGLNYMDADSSDLAKLKCDLRQIFQSVLKKPPYQEVQSVNIQGFIAIMIKLLTYEYSRFIRKMTAKYLLTLMNEPGTLRVQIFENLLNRMIPLLSKCEDRIDEFFGLLSELFNDPSWRSFFFRKGFFSTFLQVTSREIERLHKLDRSPLSQVDLDCGCLLLNVLKIFDKMRSYDELKDHLNRRAGATFLYGHAVLRSMVVKRSGSVKYAQVHFKVLMDCMKSGGAALVRSYAEAAFELLRSESAARNWQYVLHICDSIRSVIYPEAMRVEQFQIQILQDSFQENHLRNSLHNRIYLSTDNDMGPRMRDIKNKICRDCEMIPFIEDDNTLELIVLGKVIALYLDVAEVYKYLWLPESGPSPMIITYRIRGLSDGAGEEYVWELPTTVWMRLMCLRSMAFVPIASMVRENRLALLSPEINTIPVIMKKVLLILMDDIKMQGMISDTALRIICRLYEDADLFSAPEFENFSRYHLTELVISLMDVVRNKRKSIDERSEELVMRAVALVTMGNKERIDAVVEYFDTFTDFSRYDKSSTPDEQKMGRMLCFFVNGLPESANGSRIREAFFNRGFTHRAVNYLSNNCPSVVHQLSSSSSEMETFLRKPALDYVLKFLNDICRSCEPNQVLVADNCLSIVHTLELIPNNERNLGNLSHQLMVQLNENTATSHKVAAVRERTRLAKKTIATASRNVQLTKLGMRMSKDGIVQIASSVYLNVDLPDEGHFACVICQEGFHVSPHQEMGIYVFMKSLSVRDVLLDSVDGFIPDLVGPSTVTQFNLVHYQCHSNSVEHASSFRYEWDSATLHNANTLCNAILPYPGPEIELNEQLLMMKRYEMQFNEVFPGKPLSCDLVISDLKCLLIRFCWKKSFSTDSHGGGPESNMHLIPYMLYLGGLTLIAMDKDDDDGNRLRSNLSQFLADGSEFWFANAFDANGLFFQSTLFILYHDHAAWATHRLDILKRFICAGHHHALFHQDGQKEEPIEFKNYIPYLIYFALINSIYTHMFKSVSSVLPGTDDNWLKLLLMYISANYVDLYNSSTQLFATYENHLLRFTRLVESIPDPDAFFSNCLSMLPSDRFGNRRPGANMMKSKRSVPTVEEMAHEKLTRIAASYWASFGNAHRPFSAKVVADIYKNELLEKNFAVRPIVLLEFSQYLERFLWPNFDVNTATVEHVMSILVMANEKIRECVPLWPIFFTREKEFEKFFTRVLEMSLDDELLTIAEQLHVIIFLNHCFTSVAAREQCLNENMKLKKYWKYSQKQFDKLDEESKRKTLFYWRYICDLIKKFLKILHSIPPEDEQCDLNSIRYCERFLEMLIDMESLLPIRRFLNVVLLESRILCHGALSTLVKRQDGGLFTELLSTLKRCVYFEIDDLTGESLTQKDMTIIHVERITKLQKYKEKMKTFYLSTVSEVDNRKNLFKYFSVLSDEELLNLCVDLNLVDPNNTNDSTLNRPLLMEMMVCHHEKQPSQLDRINEMSLYPSEEILWNEKMVPVGYFKNANEIRLDIEDAIFRMQPWKHEIEPNTLVCGGWARMALPIMHFVVIEVGRPRVGEKAPSVVRADVQLMLDVRQDVRTEWESLRKHDVGFLLTIRPTALPGTLYCPSEPFLPQIPVVYVRGCEIEGMLGVDGNVIEEYAPPEAKLGFTNNVRTFRVLLDCQQYRLDMMQHEKGGEDVYQTFNVFVRRKPKENNFKAVLDTIRQLMNCECVVPSWFNDLLLGYGDPSVAHYSKMEKQFTVLNFDDTFLSVEHVKESFPDEYEIIANENDLKPPYRISVDETDKKVCIFQEKDESRGPYPFCRRRFNAVLFTKAQVDGIYSGMQHGLTVIVGPPGTGKTDVAAQIINNIYHGWPSERTLVVAHSNQALNYLFQKITERDVDERHLLRLGHGEEFLGMGKDFSREGRVNHILEKRLQLLGQVERLQKSIQVVGGDVASSCETALYFYEYQLQPRWFEFQRKSKQLRRVGEIFPFGAFFDDLDGPLFLDDDGDEEKGELNYEQNMQIAHSCWNYIRNIFDQLAEFRAFESLRTRYDRVEYLLTSQAKVIAMTCTHAALRRKEFVDMYFHYDNLIVEEAAQILEIETFIPFLLQPTVQGKNRLRRLVLIGDHYQLPPVVKSPALRRYSRMEQSMFTRLVRLGVRTIHLDKQGRARQQLAALYSWRYDNLGNLPHVLANEEFLTANAGFAHPFQLVDVDDFNGDGETTPVAYFYQNLAEAEYAVAIFMYMRIVGYPAEKITILTTYNGQKHLIRDVLRKRCASNIFFGKPAKVTTVDKYQGEQNDYIILSLVRTEAVGHIRDVRRLVVAFSRGRLGLYVLARVSLFENCFELTPAFRMFQNRPRKLIIIPNETWPTKRLVNEPSPYCELTIDGMSQMVNFVYDLYVSNFDVIRTEQMKQHGESLTPTESCLPVLSDNEKDEVKPPEEENQQSEDSAIVFEVLDE